MAKNKTVRLDGGYMNAFMPGRGRMSNFSAEMMAGTYFLNQQVLQAAYMHNGFARLICDVPAEEMTRAGFEVDELPEELEQKLMARLEELCASKKFNEAFKWQRAFGGGMIVLGINDGGALVEGVNEPNVKSVDFMRVYDKFEAYPQSYYSDPADPKFGEIEIWQISPKTASLMPSYSVHETRVLVFDGESVPNDVRASNQGWGASVIQTCFIQLGRLDNSHKFANLLLERMQQAVHGIPNLSQQVDTAEGEAEVTKRVDVVDRVRSALNTVIIDAAETYDIKSLSLSGIKDVLDKFLNALSAVSGIPTFLLGEFIGGLSNGDSNKEGWYSKVEAWQNNSYRQPLDRLISLILLGFSDGSSDGADYTIEFNPLSEVGASDQSLMDLQEAQANNYQMQTLTGLANGQIIDPEEAREVVREKYNLIGDAPEPEPQPEPGPITLNPGQRLVAPVPGQHNPAPGVASPTVGKKNPNATKPGAKKVPVRAKK